MGLETRHITPSDFPAIIDDLAVIEDIASADRDEALKVLHWWFFENPWGDGVFAGAFEGSRLVSLTGVTPKMYVIRGEPVLGAEVGRVITHPDFRGKGLLSTVVQHLLDVARELDYAVIIGHPNANSHRVFVGKLNFTDVFHFDRSARPTNWKRLGSRAGLPGEWAASLAGAVFDSLFSLSPGGYFHELSTHVAPDLESFLTAACTPFDCYLKRTNDYVRWRLSRPGRRYHQVYLRTAPGGDLRGWAAVRFVEVEGLKRAHIGDMWAHPDDERALRALLAGVALEARQRSMDQLYAISRSPQHRNRLTRLGFFHRPSLHPIIAFAPAGFDLARLDDWEYRDSDADMF